jgi:tetratricopeptide (TPR) repeat protein
MEICGGLAGRKESNTGLAQVSQHEAVQKRIFELGSWMMILGTSRLMCAFAVYVNDLLEFTRHAWPSSTLLVLFAQVNSPIIILAAGWPLILGIIVRRTRSRWYLGASVLTFVVLSAIGIVTLLTGVFLKTAPTIVIGSFTVSRHALLHFLPADMIRALLGIVQLTLELATGMVAWSLACSLPSCSALADGSSGSTRARLRGRMAIYLSLAFLVFSIRLPVWSAYLALLQQSSILREFMLKNDTRPHLPYNFAAIKDSHPRPEFEFEVSLSKALQMTELARYQEARHAYVDVIARADAMIRESDHVDAVNTQRARALNNLAWLLATCPDPSIRQPVDALAYAQRAVKLQPDEGTYWNTLGVAQYRLQHLEEAAQAFRQSMSLRARGEGDAFDWYFLAMIDARKGQKQSARHWYDEAVAWSSRWQEGDDELYRFRTEAAELLGLEKPPAPTHRRPRGMGHPGMPFGMTRKRPLAGPTLIRHNP